METPSVGTRLLLKRRATGEMSSMQKQEKLNILVGVVLEWKVEFDGCTLLRSHSYTTVLWISYHISTGVYTHR